MNILYCYIRRIICYCYLNLCIKGTIVTKFSLAVQNSSLYDDYLSFSWRLMLNIYPFYQWRVEKESRQSVLFPSSTHLNNKGRLDYTDNRISRSKKWKSERIIFTRTTDIGGRIMKHGNINFSEKFVLITWWQVQAIGNVKYCWTKQKNWRSTLNKTSFILE